MNDDSLSPLDGHLPGQPRFRVGLALAVLVWERGWRVAWAPACVLGAYLALILFGLPQSLPGGAHAILMVVAAIGTLAAAWWGGRGFRAPTLAEAKRRLESDSGLAHRPLQTLDDRVSGNDPVAIALWRVHQERARSSLGQIRVGLPRPAIVERDPYALRVAVALVLSLAAVGSWGDWGRRIESGLTPRFAPLALAAAPTLDVWLTPPDYTGLPPQFLRMAGQEAAAEPAAGAIRVPRGSMLLARVRGGDIPRLEANGAEVGFETIEPGTYQVRQSIDTGPRIALLQRGEVLAAWPVTIVPDLPPMIDFAHPPEPGRNGQLRIGYSASDDYGLVSAAVRIRRAPTDDADGAAKTGAAPFEQPITLPSGRPRLVDGVSALDLASHPWAGLPALIALTAGDGAGQMTASPEVPVVLPERSFTHPVARAVIAIRKELVAKGDDARAPSARGLLGLGLRPDDFGGDFVVALTLRAGAARLLLDQDSGAVPAVVALLWDTALRIEDGLVSVAERDLREAQRQLGEALDRGAADAEIAQLMEALQQAIDQYLAALEAQLRQALERGETVPEIPAELAQQMGVTSIDELRATLDRMRTLAETGSRDAAREMLSRLQQMMENLRMGTVTPEERQRQDQALGMMREMRGLIERQQQLLDEAFRVSQSGDSPGRTPGGQTASPLLQSQAERQERLRRDLGDLMRRFGELTGEIPSQLGRAERAMRNATQALRRGQPDAAVTRETQAIDELEQSLQSFADSLIQQMSPGAMMPGAAPGRAAGGRGADPLGRPGMGPIDNEDVRIPRDADIQRAREILDELRRRAGELNRPRFERDYIDRLLRQF